MTIINSNNNPNFNSILVNKYYTLVNNIVYNVVVPPLKINNGKSIKNNVKKINQIKS